MSKKSYRQDTSVNISKQKKAEMILHLGKLTKQNAWLEMAIDNQIVLDNTKGNPVLERQNKN